MRRAAAPTLLLLALFRADAPAAGEGVPVPGDDFVVTGTVRVRPGVYRIADANGDGVIRVRGEGARLDLTGVTLVGAPDGAAPDSFAGVGVSVDGAPGAVVTGGAVRGFRIGVRVHGSPRAVVEDVDASGNFRQRLRSTVEREDEGDWLWGHENDDGRWERDYGAGIALKESPGAVVRGCVVRGGQNGLLLDRCDGSKVHDCDFSFDSGWGLAMWRTSGATVCRNSMDWCVRGYSHGVYARGQDSTGILVYEQCDDNVFALNSATHGGDGFFLYAGNETLRKTGTGGCNGNVVWRNDFSHAVANGIEATFSRRNRFLENRLDECDHGVWAGYSYETEVAGNTIAGCANGVSIEHGHLNVIEGNTVRDCGVGVHLWWDDDADLSASVYGRKNETRSMRNRVGPGNRFAGNRTDVRLRDDTETSVVGNLFEAEPRVDVQGERRGTNVDLAKPLSDRVLPPTVPFAEKDLPGRRDPFLPQGSLRGRRCILVDEWGPVDPRETRLFPSEVAASGTARLSVLGAAGEFKVKSVSPGFDVVPASGRLPGTIEVRRAAGAPAGASAFEVEVEAGGKVHRARGTLFSATWDVRFFRWTKDPREDPDAWKALVAGEPAESRTLDALDFRWQGGKVSDAVGADRFGTVATTDVELPAGRWDLRTVSDDGIRVWVDDRLVVDDWTWHGPTPHDALLDLAAGKHRIRVEHFEIDGWAVLAVTLAPRR